MAPPKQTQWPNGLCFSSYHHSEKDKFEFGSFIFVRFRVFSFILSLLSLRFAMEREWPSVKNCPQYKYGMIQPYLVKYEWEDKEHIDDSAYYDSSDEEGDRRVNTHQVVKKFLQQVRDSRGYDVDCMPPVRFGSPFRKVDLECELKEDESFAEEVNEAIELAIERINKKNGKPYELVDVLKVVETTNLMLLLTFTAREVGSAAAETFIAMVYVPVPDGDFQLLECMLRPEDAAPTDV